MTRSLFFALTLFTLTSSCNFNRIFYYPDKDDTIVPKNVQLRTVVFDKDKTANALFYPLEEPIASVFFLHGNSGNLNLWKPLVNNLYDANFQVYIVDYPGFGDSEGKPNHKNVQETAQLAFDDFKNLSAVHGTKVILMGFSLGGNLATKIGTDNQESIDAMVLEGAFSSHKAIGADRTPRPMKFSAYLIIKNAINGKKLMREWIKPLLIVHSTEDPTCPYYMGVDLFENAASTKKELWTIKGKHLEGMNLHLETYMKKVKALIE